jgi:hypothetical protein
MKKYANIVDKFETSETKRNYEEKQEQERKPEKFVKGEIKVKYE